MFHTRLFYATLGIPETVVEPTAYELFAVRPEQFSPDLIERIVCERKKDLRFSTPGPSFVPVIAALEEKLEDAASILRDSEQRRAYYAHLGSRARKRALKTAGARHRKLIAAVLEATDSGLAPDGTLSEDDRRALAKKLLAIGVSAGNVETILGEIPRPAPARPPTEPLDETLSFFAGTIALATSQGILASDDELQLAELATRLAIPREIALRVTEHQFRARGVHRNGSETPVSQTYSGQPQGDSSGSVPTNARPDDPATAARRERFLQVLCRLYPERDATPKDIAALQKLGTAQRMDPHEVDLVLRDYFEPPPPPPPPPPPLRPSPRAIDVQAPTGAAAPSAELEVLPAEPLAAPLSEEEIPMAKAVDERSALQRHVDTKRPVGGTSHPGGARGHPGRDRASRPGAGVRWRSGRRRTPRHRGSSAARSPWLGVAALVVAALVLGLTLLYNVIMSQSPTPRPPSIGTEPPKDPSQKSLAQHAKALRQLAHTAAGPVSPSSSAALKVLTQIAWDPPEEGLPQETWIAAVSALCHVIRQTGEAGTARQARDRLARLVPVTRSPSAALAASLEGDLSTPAERQQAAAELEKAILVRQRPTEAFP